MTFDFQQLPHRVSPPLWLLALVLLLVVAAVDRPVLNRRSNHTNQMARTFPDALGHTHDETDEIARVIWQRKGALVCSINFSPDDAFVVATTWANADTQSNSQIVVIETTSGREVCSLDSDRGTAICFTPTGDAVAVLSRGSVSLYDARTGTKVIGVNPAIRDVKFEAIESVGFSPDGRFLIGADRLPNRSERFRAWDLGTGETVAVPEGEFHWAGRGLSPNGRLFEEGGWPGPTPRVFDCRTGERITYCFREKWPVAAAFTPDSQRLVTIHKDGALVVWELRETGNENARQLLSEAGFEGCTALAIAWRGNHVAVGLNDGSIALRKITLP